MQYQMGFNPGMAQGYPVQPDQGYSNQQPQPAQGYPNQYNRWYPNQYNQVFPTAGYQMPQVANTKNEYDWVQGETGAKSYQVPAGQSVLLMDSDNTFFFQKSTDVTGKPLPLEYYKFEKITEEEYKAMVNGEGNATNQAVDLSGYVKRDELSSMIQELTEQIVTKKMGEMSFKATPGDISDSIFNMNH